MWCAFPACYVTLHCILAWKSKVVMKNHCTGGIFLLLSALLFQGAHTQDGSIMVTLTITPGVLVPESIGFVQACVMLDDEPAGDVMVALQTTDGTAQAGSDYGSVTQELTFSAGPTLTQCVNITIIQDSAVENSIEFFSVQATTSSSSITGLPVSRAIIIQDDMDQITIGFEQGTYTVQEDQPTVEVCAEILQGSVERSTAVTFTFGVQSGLADASDFTLAQTMGSFQSGDMRSCTSVTILGDNRVEGTETFTVTLIGTSEVEISNTAGTATVEIIDDDGAAVSLQSVSPVLEPGNTGDNINVDVCALVSASGPIDRDLLIIITFNTVAGTADSGDFQPLVDEMLTTTLTSAGSSSMCQSVTILGDIVVEDNETFSVTASVDAPNTVTPPATATVTITDDDGITVSLQSVTPVSEPGNDGNSTVDVCVAVEDTPGLIDRVGDIVITFNTVLGTAGSSDFLPLSNQMLTIPPTAPAGSASGATPVGNSMCQQVTILGDTLVEDDESFTIMASVTSPDTIAQPTTVSVTIMDDDGITVSLQSITPVSEPGNDGNTTVDVCVTVEDTPGPIDRVGDIVITFNTVSGTAGSGDFLPLVNQTLTIPPTTPVGNSTCQQVTILGDTVVEDDETFTIMASVASPDIIEQPTTVNVTLMDDDGISVSLQNVRLVANEPGDSGDNFTVNVCVTLDSAPGLIERAGVITFNTEEGTADSDDFEPLSNQMLTIPPATPVGNSICQPITILGDDIDEENETFSVIVSVARPDNITSPDTITVTIIDDDVVDCSTLSDPANGRVSHPNGTTSGQIATYSCDPGYNLTGESIRMCQVNTTWSGITPTCQLVDCNALSDPANGHVSHTSGTTFGEAATYSCELGYILIGESPRICQINGTWSGRAPTCQHLFLMITVPEGFCDEEAMQFLLWPETPAGITRSLPCPNTTTIINRTCNTPGIWDNVDPSLCIPHSSINTDITVDNYDEAVIAVSGAVRGAAVNEQEQTTDNLAIVTAIFERSAALITNNTIVREATVQELVRTLEGLQQWNPDVLQTNSSNIVQSFEAIVSTFAQQLAMNDTFLFMTETILFVAELIPRDELAAKGRSFSSSNLTGITNPITLSASETAAAFLPASLFQSITDQNGVGIFFAVYDAGVLFPITNDMETIPRTNSSITTVVGSPVLAATVGPGLNFVRLAEPVRILLQLNEELDLRNVTSLQCVSWNFTLQEWTTEGCETVMNDGGIVTCNCNHLTNFAILVDICSRFSRDCQPSGPLVNVLGALTIIGVVLSLIGIVATIITLLLFKKLRQRDASKYHIQLCIALFYMLIVFVTGIDKADKTRPYGGCVAVSVLIHYFTLVIVMWMGAEAVLMYQKLITVFVSITTRYIIVVSLVCWLMPIIPVIIPLAVDISDAVSRDLVVRWTTETQQGFCFISDAAVFFSAFLGPIFAILLFNIVIFVLVIRVIIKHNRRTLSRSKEGMNKKTAVRLLISFTGVMFLFGLTWLFGALTITGFGDSRASTAFQVLFVILNAFQGFFIFVFFCVFNKDARVSWMEVFTCGSCQSRFLHPSQVKHASSGTPQEKVITANTNLGSSNLCTSVLPRASNFDSSTENLIEEKSSNIPLTSEAEEDKKEKPYKGSPEVHEMKKADFSLLENSEGKDQGLEKTGSTDSREHRFHSQWRDGVQIKAQVKRYSTKKVYKHHIESFEMDFWDNCSDDSDEPDDTKT